MRRFPWPEFAFLIVTAIAYYYAGKLILLIAGIVLLVRIWLWASMRYAWMIPINLLIAAMCSSGRRRRR